MMYKGYELALKRKRPVSFKFKGVETTLHPDQQEVDDQMIEIRLKDVLKELNRVSNVRDIHIYLYIYISIYLSIYLSISIYIYIILFSFFIEFQSPRAAKSI